MESPHINTRGVPPHFWVGPEPQPPIDISTIKINSLVVNQLSQLWDITLLEYWQDKLIRGDEESGTSIVKDDEGRYTPCPIKPSVKTEASTHQCAVNAAVLAFVCCCAVEECFSWAPLCNRKALTGCATTFKTARADCSPQGPCGGLFARVCFAGWDKWMWYTDYQRAAPGAQAEESKVVGLFGFIGFCFKQLKFFVQVQLVSKSFAHWKLEYNNTAIRLLHRSLSNKV